MSNETIDQQLPEKGSIQIKPAAIKFGLLAGFCTIILSLLLYFINLQFNTWAKWIPTIAVISLTVFGIKAIADENKNKAIPFGSLFSGGMMITAIAAVFSVLYFILYSNIIEPDFIDKLLDISREEMAKKGLSEEQMDAGIAMTKKFMSPALMITFSILGSFIFGAIASAIGAAIFKKEK